MFKRINVAIQPTEEVREYIFALSEQIAKETDTYFVIDSKNFYPHATLYATEYPEKNVETILGKVAEIVRNTPAFTVSLEKFYYQKGYFDLQVPKTEELMQLHDVIVRALNPLRENHLRKKYTDPAELAKLTPEKQENILKYGYHEIYNAFRPHFTISRIKDESVSEAVMQKLAFKPLTFQLEKITAFSMGDHGTCTGILEEFSCSSRA